MRAGYRTHLSIIARPLIPIGDRQGDRSAECDTRFYAGEYNNLVRLVSRRREMALSRTTPIELQLDISFRQLQAGGQPSIIAPTAAQCDSPKVVTLNNVP